MRCLAIRYARFRADIARLLCGKTTAVSAATAISVVAVRYLPGAFTYFNVFKSLFIFKCEFEIEQSVCHRVSKKFVWCLFLGVFNPLKFGRIVGA